MTPRGFRRKVIRLCAYENCDWRGTIAETRIELDKHNLADAEQLAHMFYTHGYPYQPWRYRAVRRAYA